MTCEKKSNEKRKNFAIMFLSISIIFIVWLWTPKFISDVLGYRISCDAGSFGDLYGSINSLFSGLAFLGIIISLVYQRKDINLSIEEQKLTRRELEGQKEQLVLQNQQIKQQSFSNDFYNMMTLFSAYIESLTIYYNSSNEIKGRSCISNFLREKKDRDTTREELKSHFSGYFSVLSNIFTFIEELEDHNDASKTKAHYLRVLRSHLSSNELELIELYLKYSDEHRSELSKLIETRTKDPTIK